jgi:hypothetical protein
MCAYTFQYYAVIFEERVAHIYRTMVSANGIVNDCTNDCNKIFELFFNSFNPNIYFRKTYCPNNIWLYATQTNYQL